MATKIIGLLIFIISAIFIIRGGLPSIHWARKYNVKLLGSKNTSSMKSDEFYSEKRKAFQFLLTGFLIFIVGGMLLALVNRLISYALSSPGKGIAFEGLKQV